MRVWHIQLNPIIVKEVRTRMRGMRPYLILTGFLVLLALTGLGIYQLMLQQARFGGTVLSAQVGQALFRGLSFVELLLIIMLAPALTSATISSEREQLTYDMLMATPLRPGQLLWGKLLAALSYLFLLIFASLPVFSIVLVFGGVEPRAIVKTVVLLLVTTVAFGAIGLFCSSLLRRTARATTVAYILVVLLISVPLLIGAVWGQFSNPPGQPPPPMLYYLNPLSALFAVTTIEPGVIEGGFDPGMMPFIAFDFSTGGLPFLHLLSSGVIFYGPTGVVVIPIYRATLIGYSLMTVLLCWISAHLVLPHRRWHLRWTDLGFALLLIGLGAVAYFTHAWWYLVPPPLVMGPAG
ncbi:MAG: ABC transporter permease [Chloroflexia bacterium]|nr:ABC transporter permease [Chloroflexia bacterium]